MQGELSIPIYYEDTDFSGFVYHANYLKFFERAREELFGRKKLRDFFSTGSHFVVREANLVFHKPARHGDVIRVQSHIDFTSHPVIVICQQTAFNQEQGDKLVTGSIQLVTVNERGFPVRVLKEFFQGGE